MLYKISHDNGFHYWDEKNEPVLRIQPGDSVEFETKDCLCNVLTEQKSERYDVAVFDKVKMFIRDSIKLNQNLENKPKL